MTPENDIISIMRKAKEVFVYAPNVIFIPNMLRVCLVAL
jgi:hypothetical protein